MIYWLTETVIGRFLTTLCISMMPIIELRAGLPYGIALGLDYPVALTAAVIGNLLPVPFIILFIRKIFAIMKNMNGWFSRIVSKMENKADSKSHIIAKYGPIGLILLVAIPLPGTGAWTGALVAALLDIRLKNAFPSIVIGVLLAAGIMTAITFGVITVI